MSWPLCSPAPSVSVQLKSACVCESWRKAEELGKFCPSWMKENNKEFTNSIHHLTVHHLYYSAFPSLSPFGFLCRLSLQLLSKSIMKVVRSSARFWVSCIPAQPVRDRETVCSSKPNAFPLSHTHIHCIRISRPVEWKILKETSIKEQFIIQSGIRKAVITACAAAL